MTSASLRRASELKSSSSRPSTTCSSCLTAANSGLLSPTINNPTQLNTCVADVSKASYYSWCKVDSVIIHYQIANQLCLLWQLQNLLEAGTKSVGLIADGHV